MYAIELYLDPAAAAPIRALWQRLASAGFTAMLENGCEPHVTLAVFNQVAEAALVRRLATFFGEQGPPPLAAFSVLGSFPGSGVLHCTPTTTLPLLTLHRRLYQAIGRVAAGPYPHYLPGAWVPHCTLAIRLEPQQLPTAFALALRHWTPFTTTFDRVALVRPLPRSEALYVQNVANRLTRQP